MSQGLRLMGQSSRAAPWERARLAASGRGRCCCVLSPRLSAQHLNSPPTLPRPAALVQARHPAAWRETLAAILTSAPPEQFEALVAGLAARLAAAGNQHAATLCFVCSGDVDAAVRHWSKVASSSTASGSGAASGGPSGGSSSTSAAAGPSVAALEELMEKAVVLGLGTSRPGMGEALGDLVARYAELLAANGRLGMALEYLDLLPGEGGG